MSSRTLLSTSTPRQARRRACKLGKSLSLASLGSAGFVPCQRQDLVRAHTGVRGAAEDFQGQAASDAFTGRVPGLTNEGVIPSRLELDFRMRQKAQPVTNLLSDGDLSLGSDLPGNTPTSKCRPAMIRCTPLRGKAVGFSDGGSRAARGSAPRCPALDPAGPIFTERPANGNRVGAGGTAAQWRRLRKGPAASWERVVLRAGQGLFSAGFGGGQALVLGALRPGPLGVAEFAVRARELKVRRRSLRIELDTAR